LAPSTITLDTVGDTNRGNGLDVYPCVRKA
jgi:hypothetical protein